MSSTGQAVETSPEACTPDQDLDGDGYCPPLDCDDENAAVNPGEREICFNGIDDNCNGQVDECRGKCNGCVNPP